MLIWICIVGSILCYVLVGYHVFRSRNQLRSFSTSRNAKNKYLDNVCFDDSPWSIVHKGNTANLNCLYAPYRTSLILQKVAAMEPSRQKFKSHTHPLQQQLPARPSPSPHLILALTQPKPRLSRSRQPLL